MSESSDHVKEHIATIAKHEEQFQSERTVSERLGGVVGRFAGSLSFVILHVAFIGIWLWLNSEALTTTFDARPFPILALILAVEAVLLASFILMRQNTSTRRAEERDQLAIQMILLSEKEITKILQMQTAIADRLGLKHFAFDEEVQQLSETTSLDGVAQHIKERLPRND